MLRQEFGRENLHAMLLWSGQAFAQSTVPASNDEISKETKNLIVTLPLRYQADFDEGPHQATILNPSTGKVIVPHSGRPSAGLQRICRN
jgi:hypothetical protein